MRGPREEWVELICVLRALLDATIAAPMRPETFVAAVERAREAIESFEELAHSSEAMEKP